MTVYPLSDAQEATRTIPVLIVATNNDELMKLRGKPVRDWTAAMQTKYAGQIKRHSSNGVIGDDWTMTDGSKFIPVELSASDGGFIDINNRARLGTTLTGAGAGAALGGITGYMGASAAVQDRWVTAVQEYKDSLQTFYCATGTQFIAPYNSVGVIPASR
jgi:hypothetical protein